VTLFVFVVVLWCVVQRRVTLFVFVVIICVLLLFSTLTRMLTSILLLQSLQQYEIAYGASDGWFGLGGGRKCRKLNHSATRLSAFNPFSFLFGSAVDPVGSACALVTFMCVLFCVAP
jgi:hypothetical protein